MITVGGKTIRQEAAELDARLNDRLRTKATDSDKLMRILTNGTSAQLGALAKVIDVIDGKVVIQGNSLAELEEKRSKIMKLYDQTYQPNNGLQSFGQDPNRSGLHEPNKAPNGWKDPNGRRLT